MKPFRLYLLLCISITITLTITQAQAGQVLEMQKIAGDNPCSLKKTASNPCNTKNPCASKQAMKINSKMILRPNNTKLYSGQPRASLVKVGARLFKDTSLSGNGLSCNDCHATDALFKANFAKPYPHKVGMAKKKAGVSGKLNADEFVQFCMIAPMASKALPWESKQLASLSAYVIEVKQKAFIKKELKNPCSIKKSGASNPCKKVKNPCSK